MSDRFTIRTGGQSGVDRASLDVAATLGITYEGWCPAGGWAEDMTDPPGLLTQYPELIETTADNKQVADAIKRHPALQGASYSDPSIRTVMNVEASTALLTLTRQSARSGGTNLAVDVARAMGMLEATILLDDPIKASEELKRFFAQLPHGAIVDFNGPRLSEAGGIYGEVFLLLSNVLSQLQAMPSCQLDGLDIDIITHWGVNKQDAPYIVGVYRSGDTDRLSPFAQHSYQTLQEAKDGFGSITSAWNDAHIGMCLQCEEVGWTVDETSYCYHMNGEHEPVVCGECYVGLPCEIHTHGLTT